MSTLSQEDTSILLCYFQYKIKQNKIIMQLKDEYKKEKPIPLRTLKNGKKIPLCGEKYYCYYFGDTNGKQIFSARKKLFSIFSLIEFCITNLNLDNKTIYDLNKLNSELKSKVSDKLSEFYTSIEGEKLKKQLSSKRLEKSQELSNRIKQKWESTVWREHYLKSKQDKKSNKKISIALKEYYSVPENKAKLMLRANNPDRIQKISNAAKKMWMRAKTQDLNLYEKMKSYRFHKKHIINGVNMNSIEAIVANELSKNNIIWEYEKTYTFGETTFIPDFSFEYEKKQVILECYGDFWHANPKIYTSTDIILNKLPAKLIWEQDDKRKTIFEQNNFIFISIWESDIITSKFELIQFLEKI